MHSYYSLSYGFNPVKTSDFIFYLPYNAPVHSESDMVPSGFWKERRLTQKVFKKQYHRFQNMNMIYLCGCLIWPINRKHDNLNSVSHVQVIFHFRYK